MFLDEGLREMCGFAGRLPDLHNRTVVAVGLILQPAMVNLTVYRAHELLKHVSVKQMIRLDPPPIPTN